MGLNPSIRDWRGKTVWIIGASSGIGRATASALHAKGASVIVSARNAAQLDAFVREHPGSRALTLDVAKQAECLRAVRELVSMGAPDLVCYCAGYYSPMRASDLNLGGLMRHQIINVEGVLVVLSGLMPALLAAARAGRSPHLSLVSSVAGFRGLPKGLAYGPTKASLINLAETLFLDLRSLGVGVSVINPGFVKTPLTDGNEFAMPALISPEQAAQAILKGWSKGAFEIHFPRRFTWVIKTLRLLPYRLYFPLVHRFTGL